MLDYKKNINNLIYFIAKYNNLGIIHNRIKQISNDEYKCINEQEKEIVKEIPGYGEGEFLC